jgi:23S rRNA maturation-related 3'-5' exoribonuclease YhaM
MPSRKEAYQQAISFADATIDRITDEINNWHDTPPPGRASPDAKNEWLERVRHLCFVREQWQDYSRKLRKAKDDPPINRRNIPLPPPYPDSDSDDSITPLQT